MGHLLTRAKRVLRGKLAGLIEASPAAHCAGAAIEPESEFGFEPEPEPEPEAERSSSGEPTRQRAAEEAWARAFAVLEVAPDGAPGELHSAYRRLCRRYHPDRFDHDAEKSRAANELLAEINAAYALLTGARKPR